MKCDFCDNEAIVSSGYRRCKVHAREQDRIAIHLMILDVFPLIPIAKIHELCSEMFGTSDYSFSLMSNVYKILDRGSMGRDGWYITPLPKYVGEVFTEFLRIKHPGFYEKVINERTERFY
jgi:hypothetical protein